MIVDLQLFGGRGGSSGGGGVFGTASRSNSISSTAKKANPNYSKGREYQVNCQRVVYAAEMLRRGYNVEAKAAILNKVDKPASQWKDGFKNQTWEHMGDVGDTKNTVEKNIISTMKGYGPNARGIVYVAWEGGGAHVFNIETDRRGNVRAYDAQPGDTSRNILHNYISAARPEYVRLSRVDNLQPNTKVLRGMIKKK